MSAANLSVVPYQSSIGYLDSLLAGDIEHKHPDPPVRKLTKFETFGPPGQFDKIGHDCIAIIMSYLNQFDSMMLTYLCKCFYNFKSSKYSDATIFIHQSHCLEKEIEAEQLLTLMQYNNSRYAFRYLWKMATTNYRKNVKIYVKILEHISCATSDVGDGNTRCYICNPSVATPQNTTWSIYTGGDIFVGGSITVGSIRYAGQESRPPVFDAVEVGVHARALEDSELAIGSHHHTLKIIERDGKSYIDCRINGRKARLMVDFL
jgi:hypothetical protein